MEISQELTLEDRMLVQITQFYLVTVKLIFEFVRRLPGFDSFPNMDQVDMLRAGHLQNGVLLGNRNRGIGEVW